MTAKLLAAVLLPFAFCAGVFAAPPEPVLPADPPEEAALRAEYDGALNPLHEKLDEAIKVRAAKYVTDLKAAEVQAVTDGNLNALPALHAEIEAYASGKGGVGFSENDKKVPSSARELRRAYERDVVKIRGDLAPGARSALAKYLQQLDDLERKFVNARNPDGILAVRKEKQSMQGASQDPLNWGSGAVVGEWTDPASEKFTFHQDGTINAENAAGTWFWEDRGKRRLVLLWNGGNGKIVYQMAPDGLSMSGHNLKNDPKTLTKAR